MAKPLLRIERQHGADDVGRGLLDGPAQQIDCLAQRSAGGDHFENLVLQLCQHGRARFPCVADETTGGLK